MGFHEPFDPFRFPDWRGQVGGGEPFTEQTQSIDFDGVNERLTNLTDQAIGIANVWSLMVWVQPVVNIVGTQFLCGVRRADIGNESAILLYADSSTNRLRLDWADTSATPIEITAWNGFYTGQNGLWTNVLITWTGTTMFVLKDGVDQGAPDVGVNNPSLTMVDDTRTIAVGNLSSGNNGVEGLAAQAALWRVDVRAAAADLQVSPSELDLNVDSGSYAFSGDLAHWYRPGHQGSPDLGKDYAQAGFTPTIDIEVNAQGITDADRVADVP